MGTTSWCRAWLGSLLGFAMLAAATAAERYGAEDFARKPLIEQIRLSPDGQRFAAIVNKGQHSRLVTRAVSGGGYQEVLATDNLEYLVNWFRWVNKDRLVVSVRYPGDRAVSLAHSAATMETRLVAINADGSKPVNMVRGVKSEGSGRHAVAQDNVVDWLPEDGQHILMTLPISELDPAPAVFKVNVETGKRTLYQDARTNVFEWLTDAAHKVRVGIEYDESRIAIWFCEPEGKQWRRLRSFGVLDVAEIRPLGFGRDPNILYVLADHQGLRAVHKVDLRAAEPRLELIFAHPSRDLAGTLIHDPKTGEAVGVQVNAQGNSSATYWDPAYRKLTDGIAKALPDRFNELVQMLDDGSTYLLRSRGNAIPGEFLLGQRAKGSLTVLAETQPQLDPDRLAAKTPLKLKARDGLELPAFLTLPRGVRPVKLPLVLLPHGGPQSADDLRYEPWVAFMADRGYAVLQVNFRGSTGYGQAFMEKGLKRWGLEMQDDLTDAVQALVDRGVADPQRLAVVGSSYGGYAALMAGVKTPKLFKGIFAFAPVTDLVELVRGGQKRWREWTGYSLSRQLGDLDADRERLMATSPRLQASKIEVPVVLLHGTLDRQAEYEHSVWMAQALKEAGKTPRFISFDKGDHQLSHQPYRLQLFEELDRFLLDVLGPGAQPGN